jgi:hypothetical protein
LTKAATHYRKTKCTTFEARLIEDLHIAANREWSEVAKATAAHLADLEKNHSPLASLQLRK